MRCVSVDGEVAWRQVEGCVITNEGVTLEANFFELSDKRILGMVAFEIISFPTITTFGKDQTENCKKITQAFVQLVNELHKLCGPNTCIEFIWFTEKAHHQTFASKIRVFSIVRKIGDNNNQIEYELRNVQRNLIFSLSSLQYNIQEVDTKEPEFTDLVDSIDDSCVYSIVKREKCAANANSIYPYYFTDVVPNNNTANFNSLIAALSQHENCCVSFQIFPVQLTSDEHNVINEVSAELGRIATGTMINRQMYRDSLAAEPLKVYSYYNERRHSPIFMYNILAFGERTSCASLASKLISLLQSGDDKIVTSDFMCLDLTGEHIRLGKQFPYYVWNINNRLLYHYRNAKLLNTVPLAKRLFRFPYIMSAEEVASFYRLPLHEKAMTALKSNQIVHAQEQFSTAVISENNIQLGTLMANDSSQIVIGCPEKAFTKHALIVGTPGSGKTTFSVNLLLQFTKKGIPFLAIEPTKSEYRAMIDVIPNLRIFTPGNNAVSPFIINPFIPPKGIRIEQYIPSLASAFKAAFSMPSPLDMIFLKAIRTCYIQYGWKDYSMLGDEDVTLFGLHEFILVFKQLMENTSYSREVRGNIESAGLLRLTNLIEQNNNIYDTVNTVPIEDLLTSPTVLELNSIDNAEQKSLIMALLLISTCIYTKHNQAGTGELKNVILIDEAHVLLGGAPSSNSDSAPDSQATTIKALQDMIAEIRSYGTSIIIADQEPSKVSREVVANTDIKVSFRLVQSIDKELIADSTNMDEDAQNNLSRLKQGEAYVYYSKLDTPQLVKTEDVREKEEIRLSVPDSEVAARSTYWSSHQELLKPYSECKYCKYCEKGCDFKVRSDADYIANKALNRFRSSIKSSETFQKCIYHLPNLMATEFEKYPELDVAKLHICTRIKLLRKVSLELPVSMSEKDMVRVISHFPKKATNS